MWIKPIPVQAVRIIPCRSSRLLVIGVALSSFSSGALLMMLVLA